MGLFKKKNSYADGQYLEQSKESPERERLNENIILKSDIDKMDGIQFSELVRVIFKRTGYEFLPLDLSGDYGADFFVAQYKMKLVVRAVKYQKNTSIRIEIDKLCAANRHYKSDRAWFVTSGFLTQYERMAVPSFVNITDRKDLIGLIELAKKSKI